MKKTGIVILAAILLCTDCAGKEPDGQSGTVNQSYNSADDGAGTAEGQGILTTVGAEVPLWAQGMQKNGALYTGLNLDGVGESDDEVYVATYSFSDREQEAITVLQIHLGTGETMARIFPVWGRSAFRTGSLFSVEREAVLLEVEVWDSNYLAANVFVIDVSPASGSGMPEAVVRLDTTKGPVHLVQGSLPSVIRTGSEIVDIEGSALQGLRFHTPSRRMEDWAEIMTNSTICWSAEDVGGWRLEDTHETTGDGNGWEFDTEKGSHEIAGTEEPLWAQGVKTNGVLFEGLNLDGVGEVDDAIYASSCRFGDDAEETFTVLWIHVGTGETVAEILPAHGDITVKTGKLFAENKEGVLLEVWDRSSSHEEASVYAIDVSPAGTVPPDPLPQVRIQKLDVVSVIPSSGMTLAEEGFRSVAGADIVDIEGSLLQGIVLRLRFCGE